MVDPEITSTLASNGSGWLAEIYTLGTTGIGGEASMSAIVQEEIQRQWIAADPGIMQEQVTIALVDPEGVGGGTGGVLTFTFRGNSVPSNAGLLSIGAVDRAIGGPGRDIIMAVEGQLQDVNRAIQLSRRAQNMLAAGRSLVAKNHDQVAAGALPQIDTALRGILAELEGIDTSPTAGFVSPRRAELSAFIDGSFADYITADTRWRDDNPRERTGYENLREYAAAYEDDYPDDGRELSFGDSLRIAISAQGRARAGGAALLSDVVTGGAKSRQLQLGQAYDAGQISYANWLEGHGAEQDRGNFVLAVNGIIAVATFGLGFYLGPTLTFGGSVAFGLGSGVVGGAGPLVASNWYSSGVQLSDPDMQAFYDSGIYTPGQIALAGGLGGGLGAALPIAGRVLGTLRGAGPQALAAIETGGQLPTGVIASPVRNGVIDLTIAAEGVTIRVSNTGYQVIGRAGSQTGAVLESGTWAAMFGDDAAANMTSVAVMHPRFPTAVTLGQRGWGAYSPASSSQIQMGFWPEANLLGPGTAGGSPFANIASVNAMGTVVPRPAASVSPLLLDAAAGRTVTPLASGEGAMLLGSVNAPQGIPITGMPSYAQYAGAANPFAGLVANSAFGVPPTTQLALPASASAGASSLSANMPGLEALLAPRIDWAGPTVPDTFARSITSQWGQHVADRGTGVLPYVGEGAIWQRLPTGEWAPAFYGYRPGGVPDATLTTYGTGTSDFIVHSPGAVHTGLISLRPGGSYTGPRSMPMPTSDMYDPRFALTHSRGHVIPHAQTKDALPGQMLSTLDPHNFVAHPRKYNEWIRNQMEQWLKRRGLNYTAHNIIGNDPVFTTGGYIIPEAELFTVYGSNGAAVEAYRFPLAANPAYYETLSGSFQDVVGQFGVNLGSMPRTPIVP
ncbi:hypothetical protein [Erythrobacter ani]|uniref:DNA/RNA non-specific endonuclease n=1 Tax=Erythrobacter ani TaxID=2827235 RepID=A0ABS6SMG7_9SPHN|nr:hypothetical protein [Erythrobacter ani]MBV7266233.1 hypothetical protein [Erythrobacter ani]